MVKPKINPPIRTIDVIIEILAAICLAYMAIQLITELPEIEEKVPTHFGTNGEPDAWGNKTSLLALPVITIVLYAVLTLINRFPYTFNYPVTLTEENAIRQYKLAKTLVSTLKFSTTGLFVYIQIQTFALAKGSGKGLGSSFLVAVIIASFIPIIIYFIYALKEK